jgi:hypothetical protein
VVCRCAQTERFLDLASPPCSPVWQTSYDTLSDTAAAAASSYDALTGGGVTDSATGYELLDGSVEASSPYSLLASDAAPVNAYDLAVTDAVTASPAAPAEGGSSGPAVSSDVGAASGRDSKGPPPPPDGLCPACAQPVTPCPLCAFRQVQHPNNSSGGCCCCCCCSALVEWNTPFQETLERPTTLHREADERSREINSLADKFVEAASPVVQRILSETHLPKEARAIKVCVWV